MNLVANAIDALEEGNPWSKVNSSGQAGQVDNQQLPTIWIQTEVLGDLNIQISIADNGPGIPEESQKLMFSAFYTTKPAGKGTGLGLSISQQIITEKHGGTLTCIAQVGQGTKFVITMPIEQPMKVA